MSGIQYTTFPARADTFEPTKQIQKKDGQTETQHKTKEHLYSPGRFPHPHRTCWQNVGAKDVTPIVGVVDSIIGLELEITVNEDCDEDRNVNRSLPRRS